MSEVTLITNIDFVILEPDLRMEATALLIEPEQSHLPARPMLRGFYITPDAPVFRMWLKDTSYELKKTNDQTQVELDEDDAMKPLFSGAILTIDHRRLFLQIENRNFDFCITKFPMGDPPKSAGDSNKVYHDLYDQIWGTLQDQTAKFWTAPNIVYRKWVPAATYRNALRLEKVRKAKG